MSPIQLCISGLMASNHQTSLASTATGQSCLDLDIENLESVEVPCNKFVPCHQVIDIVESAVTPDAQATTDGKTMYHRVIYLVGQHLQDNCNRCKLVLLLLQFLFSIIKLTVIIYYVSQLQPI